jgi:hypothetical protein
MKRIALVLGLVTIALHFASAATTGLEGHMKAKVAHLDRSVSAR